MTLDERTYYKDRLVWILGATSGIGLALARDLSGKGARVIASGRSVDVLTELESESDGRIRGLPLDVTEEGAIAAALATLVQSGDLPDTVLFMAAYYEPGPVDGINSDNLKQTLQVNLYAAFELVRLIAPEFYKRGSGQIAITASVAGYAGLPNGQPYSATKAALINLVESLYIEARPKGVDVKLINPGFVETPMTDKNNFAMPDILSPEEAAKSIAKGLAGQNFEIHFPKSFTRKLKLLRLLPYSLYFRIMGKL